MTTFRIEIKTPTTSTTTQVDAYNLRLKTLFIT